MSKAIMDQRGAIAGGGPDDGAGPSAHVESEPTFARVCALIGAFLTVIGGVIVWMTTVGERANLPIGLGWGSLFLVVGVCGLLFHAAVDKDLQFRLTYLATSVAVFIAGVVLCLVPYHEHVGGLFAGGFLCLFTALWFFLAVLRNETDAARHNNLQVVILVAGVVMAAVGLIGGNVSTAFLEPYGLLLAVLGLLYLLSFVGTRGAGDDLAFRVAWVVVLLGMLAFLIALARSVLPTLFHHYKWVAATPAEYFLPYGLTLMALGVVYALASYLACSDAPLAVLTRRELEAFFYSPMAYLLLFGFTVIAWVAFFAFFSMLYDASLQHIPLIEPVVRNFIFSLLPAVAMMFVVPVLTMRLLSEEQRSGTLEVLLTAPVEEPTVVLAKFLAGLVMFLFVWVPFFLFLIVMALAGAPFDYRPLLSFVLALVITGAGMIAVGLFFSSLTRNQVVAAVMTFAAMLCLVAAYMIRSYFRDSAPTLTAVLKHVSFLDSWLDTLEGKVTPTIGLVFYASCAVFFLFLTVKVLESRKWR